MQLSSQSPLRYWLYLFPIGITIQETILYFEVANTPTFGYTRAFHQSDNLHHTRIILQRYGFKPFCARPWIQHWIIQKSGGCVVMGWLHNFTYWSVILPRPALLSISQVGATGMPEPVDEPHDSEIMDCHLPATDLELFMTCTIYRPLGVKNLHMERNHNAVSWAGNTTIYAGPSFPLGLYFSP